VYHNKIFQYIFNCSLLFISGIYKPHRTAKLRPELHYKHAAVLYVIIFLEVLYNAEPDSSVGIATRYGLDGTGIESQWGRDFPHPSRPALGPTSGVPRIFFSEERVQHN
jgi:hypothetical protein